MRWADSPEQAAFRRSLRARTRPVDDDDEGWKPRPSWAYEDAPVERRKKGPPLQRDPSPGALAARRYRERLKQQREA